MSLSRPARWIAYAWGCGAASGVAALRAQGPAQVDGRPPAGQPAPAPLRPPAVPLVTHDPYFSVWSMDDSLTGSWSKHWTGAVQQMWGMARVDGATFRFLGPAPEHPRGETGLDTVPPAMAQVARTVTPTRTRYAYRAGGVELGVTFLSPLIPGDLDLLARPVTYVAWDARSVDGRPHQVALYFDAAATLAVNTPDQPVEWGRVRAGDLAVMRAGTREQAVLARRGDDVRIDWGYAYLAAPPAPSSPAPETVIASARDARGAFAAGRALPEDDDLRMPRPARDAAPVMAAAWTLGTVGAAPVSRHALLAYDAEYAVEYLGRRLRPYWRRGGTDAAALLRTAERDYPRLDSLAARFDSALVADLTRAGGARYAALAALAYRQTLAAHALAADFDGSPLYFSKENFSNGSIATIDITYPSSPFFLLLNPRLLEAQLRPVLDYAASTLWPWPYAPHDLGTYPIANGQTYGGGARTEEGQMPVEESGNVLLMTAALAKAQGNTHFAERYWPLLTRWAVYLRDKGFDPENQLSTDDFAGHLAHNANLSAKAILALGAYAQLCDATGRRAEGRTYRRLAEGMARRWARAADDGTHFRLAFDKPGTWSQKYNLVWDQLLGLGLFPPAVAQKEVAFYLTQQRPFGLPLDNRAEYAKLDWTVWTATLAQSPAAWDALVAPLYRFADETPTRVPLSDWYWTTDAKQRGFQARAVVGGVFVKALADPALWRKWNARAAAAVVPPARGGTTAAAAPAAPAFTGTTGTTGTTSAGTTPAAADCGSAGGTTGRVVCLANAFRATLTADQQAGVQAAFTPAAAARWTNLPCGAQCRNGLLFSSLTPGQQAAALALARAALSASGYGTLAAIRTADDSLRASGGGRSYGSGVYLIAFVGTPSTTSRWVLQLSGHHYAFNLAFNGPAARVAGTPFFVGLEPETLMVHGARSAPLAGRRDAIYAVLASLDSSQRAAARLDRAFTDVLVGPGQDNKFPARQGVAVSSLTRAQQALVRTAIEQWVDDLPADEAAATRAAYESAPALAATTVAYAGAPTPSAPGSYVRIDGPRVWIEFSCQKGYLFPSQVHYHTIWRDRQTDYGGAIPASPPSTASHTSGR